MSPSTEHPPPLPSADAVRLLADVAQAAGSRSKLWFGTVEHFLGRSIPASDIKDGTELARRVIDACAQRPFGLLSLADALPRLGASPEQTDLMRNLANEWQAMQFYPEADWASMRARLEPLPAQRLHVLCRESTEGRVTALPERCRSPWDALVYLTGINATPKGMPPALLFLVRLAEDLMHQEAHAPAAADCLRWAHAWAEDWELGDEPFLPRATGVTTDTAEHAGSVIIQLGPDVLERDVYVLSYWIQSDVRGWSPKRGRDRTVAQQDVQAELCQVVDAAEKELGLSEPLMVECVLPYELLNLPVERFTAESWSNVPLGARHTVFVRSLERLRNRAWHREWHSRWAVLNSHPNPDSIRFLEEERPSEGRLLNEVLVNDRRLAVLCLNAPPRRAELTAALRCGVPLVIWTRDPHPSGTLKSTVQELAHESDLADLPLRLSEVRRQALSADERGPRMATMRHLAVLWDDPQRQPEATEDTGSLWSVQ